ncbi:MAG: TetR/AcrR family transcriptional regulator [Glaciihabitans sp.]|nr:TetR/AcrR family transcriptional regulator [Glaciihabitans sp.]
MGSVPELPSRSTYRHGDLRETLVATGVAMARTGGPDAVVLREATRQAGVSPNAAYRHFSDRQELLAAVAAVALGAAADRIHQELDALPVNNDPVAAAKDQLRAVGEGYIAFAREQPGLFRTAFSVPDNLRGANDPVEAGAAGRTPFQLVGDALDALVQAKVISEDRRANAEFLAWSAVHGLSVLAIDGPLRGLTEEQMRFSITRLLDMVERGL